MKADDITPADLGNGYRLIFQEVKGDSSRVRAVVKNPDGTIFITGPVVERRLAITSRQAVLTAPERTAWMGRAGQTIRPNDFAVAFGLAGVPGDADDEDEEDEDLDDEDEDEEEEDEDTF